MQYFSIHFCRTREREERNPDGSERTQNERDRQRETGRNSADAARPSYVHFINNGGSVVASGLGSTRREKESA